MVDSRWAMTSSVLPRTSLASADLYIPQGGDKPGNGGLSAAGGAHQCVDGARCYIQADTVEHFLVVVGKADILQLDGVIDRQPFHHRWTLHILTGQHFRHLADDGFDLCNVVGVGGGGDQRLHDAEGKHDDCQKCFCRQGAVHRKEAPHRQNAEKC